MIDVQKPLFNLGQVVMTPNAAEQLQRCGQSPWEFLARHVQGDWGEVDAEDKQANYDALVHGERLLSAYTLADNETRIWCITEADRSSSAIILPSEY
jgi:hypothetical protein